MSLEQVVDDVAGGLEALVATYHASAEHPGAWEDCGRAICAPVRYYTDQLWEARLSAANTPSGGTP